MLWIVEELRQIYQDLGWRVSERQVSIIHPTRDSDAMYIVIEDATLHCCGYGDYSLYDASELTDLFHEKHENITIDLTDPQADIIMNIRHAINIWYARQHQETLTAYEEIEYFKYSHPNRVRKNVRNVR